jgi:hypothetical protein
VKDRGRARGLTSRSNPTPASVAPFRTAAARQFGQAFAPEKQLAPARPEVELRPNVLISDHRRGMGKVATNQAAKKHMHKTTVGSLHDLGLK